MGGIVVPFQHESRRPKELPLEALTEPEVNVSAHPALPSLWYPILPVGTQHRLLTPITIQPVDCELLVVGQ